MESKRLNNKFTHSILGSDLNGQFEMKEAPTKNQWVRRAQTQLTAGNEAEKIQPRGKALPPPPPLKVNSGGSVLDIAKHLTIKRENPFVNGFTRLRDEYWGDGMATIAVCDSKLYVIRSILKPVDASPDTFVKNINNENVLHLCQVYSKENQYHFIYEHADISLSDILALHRLSDSEIAFVCRNVICGLEAVHEELRRGYGHLRSNMVMITSCGQIKLARCGELQFYAHASSANDIRQLGLLLLDMYAPLEEDSSKALAQMTVGGRAFYDRMAASSLNQLLDDPFIREAGNGNCLALKAYETVRDKAFVEV